MLTDPMARALAFLDNPVGMYFLEWEAKVHPATRKALTRRSYVIRDSSLTHYFLTPAGTKALAEWREAHGTLGQ